MTILNRFIGGDCLKINIGRKVMVGDEIMRKCLSILIITLFIGISIFPSTALSTEKFQSSRGTWLYVGGSGPGNYSMIQDAIENASDGDTVFVFNDSSPYIENIKIYNEINLVGEDKNSTEIKGFNSNDEILAVTTADFVTISGFTFTSDLENSLPLVKIYSSYNKISGNIFKDNETTFETSEIGIAITASSFKCTITNNIFQNTSKGIVIGGSSFNEISNNSFNANAFGIIIDTSISNEISNNTIIGARWGISISECNLSKIIDNVLISCQYEGIELASQCSNNKILHNNIRLCGRGISVYYWSYNNRFQQNILQQNYRGMYVDYLSDYNLLENNTIREGVEYGLRVYGSKNTIRLNIIKDYEEVGIIVQGENNLFSYNLIENNGKGVYLQQESNFNRIECNNFINNTGFFLYSFKDRGTKLNIWENNYWDSINGKIKIIVGRLKILLYSWTDWFSRQTYEIALYPVRLNFDWHPTLEPYFI